jgi:hypothetical protein
VRLKEHEYFVGFALFPVRAYADLEATKPVWIWLERFVGVKRWALPLRSNVYYELFNVVFAIELKRDIKRIVDARVARIAVVGGCK